MRRRNLKGPQDKVDRRGRPRKMRQKSFLSCGTARLGPEEGDSGSILSHYVKFDLDFDVFSRKFPKFRDKVSLTRDERGDEKEGRTGGGGGDNAIARLVQSQM